MHFTTFLPILFSPISFHLYFFYKFSPILFTKFSPILFSPILFNHVFYYSHTFYKVFLPDILQSFQSLTHTFYTSIFHPMLFTKLSQILFYPSFPPYIMQCYHPCFSKSFCPYFFTHLFSPILFSSILFHLLFSPIQYTMFSPMLFRKCSPVLFHTKFSPILLSPFIFHPYFVQSFHPYFFHPSFFTHTFSPIVFHPHFLHPYFLQSFHPDFFHPSFSPILFTRFTPVLFSPITHHFYKVSTQTFLTHLFSPRLF